MKRKGIYQISFKYFENTGQDNTMAFWLRIQNYSQTQEDYKAKNKNTN